MKILAINGSGRPGGNTAHLLNAILEGAATRGHDTGMLELGDLTIRPCTSCRACKAEGSAFTCVLNDDMRRFYDQAAEVDLLIVGSPIYLGHITGNMMSFIQRLYCYLDGSNRGCWPRKDASVVTALTFGAPDKGQYDGAMEFMGTVLKNYFGMSLLKSFKLTGGPRDGRTPADNPVLQAAREFGASLE